MRFLLRREGTAQDVRLELDALSTRADELGMDDKLHALTHDLSWYDLLKARQLRILNRNLADGVITEESYNHTRGELDI